VDHKCAIKDNKKSRETKGSFWGEGWWSCLQVPMILVYTWCMHDVYTLSFPLIFFNFQKPGTQALVTGMKGQNSLGFCDIMNQKQIKMNRRVQTGMKFKFLIE
jgi:hypothetical protein